MMTKGGVFWNAGIGFAGKDLAAVDVGRKKVTGKDTDFGRSRCRRCAASAPARRTSTTAPVASLEDAVKYMASAATPNPNLSPLFNDKGLTPAEVTDLVDFLGNGLACPGGLTEPKLP
ncbi:MAG: hypothetical protein IPL61_11915 [Myxococcales bacterium]|nr:hypothetical protein [Myxococcales bacterium]